MSKCHVLQGEGFFDLSAGTVPARAASIEKGRAELPSPIAKVGGLIRVNGLAVIRRRERMPVLLLFVGERPAGAGAEEGVMREGLEETLM